MNYKLKRPKYLSLFAYVEAINHILGKGYATQYTGKREHFTIEPDYFAIHNDWTDLQFEELIDALPEEELLGLKVEVDEALGPFSVYKQNNIKFLYDADFKFCPECIKKGKHYIFNQFKFLDRCPIHNKVLTKNCPLCGGKNTKQIVSSKRHKGFCCAACKESYLEDTKPERLIRDYYEEADLVFPYPKLKEKSAFLFSTKPGMIYRNDRDFVYLNKYTTPLIFLKNYYTKRNLPKPAFSVAKGVEEERDIDLLVLELASEVVNDNLVSKHAKYSKREGCDAALFIKSYIRDRCDTTDAYAKALYNITDVIDLKSREENPRRNNYLNSTKEIIETRLAEFRCTSEEKRAIMIGIMDEVLRGAYKSLVHRILESPKAINSLDYEINLRTSVFFDIILFEQECSYDVYLFDAYAK